MTKWFDPLDLSNQKKLLDLGYIYPRGVRGGVALFFFGKSVFLKHPTSQSCEFLTFRPILPILANPGTVVSNKTTLMTYSPKQSLKFYGSRDPRLASAWPDNAILKLESIPHHFTAFSIRNCGRQPCITLHCLDYVTLPPTSSSE